MKSLHESHPKYRVRQALAVGALALTIFGVNKAADYTHEVKQHNQYVHHPETIPNEQASTITVKAGDTAEDIAIALTPKDKSYKDLSIEIQGQADKNHLLQPGQTVRVENRLIDVRSEAYQLYGQPAEQLGIPPVVE